MVDSFTRTPAHPLKHPKVSLVIMFFAWKLLLLLVAFSSPGQGYDTSTCLIAPSISTLPGKLVRWDAIYFTQAAQRNYIFEQEWAFSLVFSQLLAYLAKGTFLLLSWGTYQLTIAGIAASKLAMAGDVEALAGIAVAHVAHLISVLVLYSLSKLMFNSDPKASQIAVLSASLHIFSPAGIFLSAPYAESLFCLLQFCGYYYFVRGHDDGNKHQDLTSGLDTLVSGLLLGLATAIRSNGLLSGVLFAYTATISGMALISTWRSRIALQEFVTSVFGGVFVALGAILPQYVAYRDYCTGPLGLESRPWCQLSVPSIYAWIQSHYWNVGFLRYWTPSNIPLFLLAAPMLLCLTQSSLWAWNDVSVSLNNSNKAIYSKSSLPKEETGVDNIGRSHRRLMQLISVPQLALALLALTSYHVQIITRLSSGYPLWYWWLARMILSEKRGTLPLAWVRKPYIVLRWMVIYAIIQGGLFASFLPPA
ncbi:ER membrane glycoprotein subunit of the GPI transamidase complex-like protein [Xylographa bjoerkii]|nr:ER membrane glycoprotein subunit of the GPI transamidase complex-like protein [Xylographa bjoerkii]